MRKLVATIIFLSGILGCSHFQRGIMAAVGSPVPEEELDLVIGQEVYSRECSRCHGADGASKGPDASQLTSVMPNFTDGSYEKSLGLAAANIAYGKNEEMPAFEHLLTDMEIWSVAAYVRSLKE